MDFHLVPAELMWNVVGMLTWSVFVITLLLSLVTRPLQSISVSPQLHCRISSLSRSILRHVPEVNRRISVPMWCCYQYIVAADPTNFVTAISVAAAKHFSHLATVLLNELAPNHNHVFFVREHLQLADGGLVSLDWVFRPNGESVVRTTTPNDLDIVVIIPGDFIFDSSHSLQHVCQTFIENGYHPVIFNQRGRCGTPLTTPKIQCHGDSTDLREVLQYIEETYKGAFITSVGLSSGASLLISYLGNFGSSAIIKSAIAVSPMWDFKSSYRSLCFVPKTWLGVKLKMWFVRLAGFLSAEFCIYDVLFSSCYNLVPKIFLPFSECANDDEYYANCSPLQDADDIAVPLLVEHYNDDPFVPDYTLPTDLFSLYPHLFLLQYPHGGHCGILQQLSDQNKYDFYPKFFRQVQRFTAKDTTNLKEKCLHVKSRKRVASLNTVKVKKVNHVRSSC